MTHEEIVEKVFANIEDVIGEDPKTVVDEDLFELGLLDSMAAVELIMNLDDTFGIKIPVSEMEREDWNTPNKIAASLEKLL